MSLPGRAVVTVRFYVGEDREDSLVKIYNKIYSNTDQVPPAVRSWVVKPIEIDDVPIVIATLWSERPEAIDDFALRRIAEELEIELQAVPETNRTEVVGGRPRVVRVEIDPEALAARQTSALEVAWALGISNVRRRGGRLRPARTASPWSTPATSSAASPALRRAVVNVVDGIPVSLEDVARIQDGPAERDGYSWIGFGPGEEQARRARAARSAFLPAVHVAVAKQKGSNAVWVAERVEERIAELADTLLPGRRPRAHHAELRRDGERQGQRAARGARGRDPHRDRAHRLQPGLARGPRRRGRGADHLRADAAAQLLRPATRSTG